MPFEFYNASSSQTIYDIALKLYGDFNSIVSLLQLNPQIGSADFDFSVSFQQTIQYNSSIVATPPKSLFSQATETKKLSTIRAVYGQSIYDVCLMTYTTFDNLALLITNSKLSGVNDLNVNKTSFTYAIQDQSDKLVSSIINKFGFVFSTEDIVTFEQIVVERVTEDFILRITEDGLTRILE